VRDNFIFDLKSVIRPGFRAAACGGKLNRPFCVRKV
jgi:hypothetical protein